MIYFDNILNRKKTKLLFTKLYGKIVITQNLPSQSGNMIFFLLLYDGCLVYFAVGDEWNISWLYGTVAIIGIR